MREGGEGGERGIARTERSRYCKGLRMISDKWWWRLRKVRFTTPFDSSQIYGNRGSEMNIFWVSDSVGLQLNDQWEEWNKMEMRDWNLRDHQVGMSRLRWCKVTEWLVIVGTNGSEEKRPRLSERKKERGRDCTWDGNDMKNEGIINRMNYRMIKGEIESEFKGKSLWS